MSRKFLRMNTCKSVSKQRTLTSFRMNTYGKHPGGGGRSLAYQRSAFVKGMAWFQPCRKPGSLSLVGGRGLPRPASTRGTPLAAGQGARLFRPAYILRLSLSLPFRLLHHGPASTNALPPNAIPGSTPLFITVYPHAASKRKLTKHSQFIRIEIIKIIRDAAVPEPGYPERVVRQREY
jgi:hypothetical protein